MKPNRKVPIKPRNKTEYILSTLKKLQHKAEEQYVISRILHRLDDLSIEFVCQQYLVPDEDSYLLDLFFPQFQIFVEVNERGHSSPIGIYKDEKSKDIIKFRIGEIFVRHGSKSERANYVDIINFVENIRNDERQITSLKFLIYNLMK